MSSITRRFIRIAALTLVSAAVLSGCKNNNNIILPGERHSIRPQEAVVVQNRSAAISLGNPVSNAAWLQKGFTAAHVIPHLSLASAPTLRWSVDIGRGNSDRSKILSQPVAANGVIFTLDAAGMVSALSTQNGAVVWTKDITPVQETHGSEGFGGGLAIEGNTLFVTTGFGELLALDISTGGERWRYAFDAPVHSAPTVQSGRVFLVTRDDTAYAIDAARGSLAWSITGPRSSAVRILGGSSVAVQGRNVIIPFSSGRIFGATTGGGVRWQADVNNASLSAVRSSIGEITGDPIILGGRVFVANQSGQTSALNVRNGSHTWDVAVGATGAGSVIGGSEFMVTDSAQLLRIDARNGTIIWSVQLPEFAKLEKRRGFIVHYGPILAGGRLIVAGADGQMRFFDPVSGAAQEALTIPGGAASAPIVVAGVLYIQSKNGKLHAFQ